MCYTICYTLLNEFKIDVKKGISDSLKKTKNTLLSGFFLYNTKNFSDGVCTAVISNDVMKDLRG